MDSSSQAIGSLDEALANARHWLARDPRLAREQALEILQAIGPHPRARFLLALADDALGDAAAALASLQQLAQQHPDWRPPHRALADLLARQGRGDEAIQRLRHALALDARDPSAWLALADHLRAADDEAGAAEAQAMHLRHATQDPQLLQAADALAANHLPVAETLLRDRLSRHPSDAAALRMLAEVAARLGRLDDAQALLEHCLRCAPGFAAARHNLAIVAHRGNKPLLALEQLDQLLAQDPENPSALNLRAAVLCRLGDYAPAIAIYDRLVARYPTQAKLWLSLGHSLKTHGDRERAISAYRRAIALEPGFGEAWWSLANLKTFRFGADDLARMQAQAARTDLAEDQRAQFHFALGKAFEDAGDPDDAFRHYAEGNALRRRQVPYRAEDSRLRVRRTLQLFTPDFLRERAGQGDPSRDPIFIVGLPRSGSTLVEQILSSHPAVEGTMELPEIISLTHELRREAADAGAEGYHGVLSRLDAGRLRELGQAYLERTRVQRKTGAPHFIDKMPNNFFHVGLIHLILPNARIIDTRRHPMACGFSGYKQYFARGQNFSYDLADLGHYYRDYLAVMAHFEAVLPGRVHRVVYERMVDDTESEVRRLLDYCGLPFDPACLRFFENDRPVRTASSEQVRQPIYRDALGHWRAFERHLAPLAEALGDAVAHYPDAPPDILARTQEAGPIIHGSHP